MKQDIIHDLIFAQETAERRNIWIVVVVPQRDVEKGLRVLGAAVPVDSFSGRTAVFGDGGRLSLAGGTDEVFVPEGEEFHVMFLGWGGNDNNDGMANWRKAAKSEVRRSL